MPKFADVAPAGTMTLAGTCTAPPALESDTEAPVVPAAKVSVTVPVEGLPPTMGFGLADTDASAGAPDVGFHPSWITSKSLAVRSVNAGLRMPLFQRVSKVP